MAFYGVDFIYDGVSSKSFDVKLVNLSRSNGTSDGGVSIDYKIDSVDRSGVKSILGWKHNSTITFSLTLARESGFEKRDISKIITWLTEKGFKKLQILQKDMNDLYYNCYFNNPKILDSANMPYAITFDVVCDAPWAYESVRQQKYVVTQSPMGIFFNNTSDSIDMLKPISVKIIAKGNGDIKIKNKTTNIETIIEGATTGEVLTLNESLGLIKTSKDLRVLHRFNKKFLRFAPSVNELELTNIAELIIEYQYIRKIGG